MCDDDDNYCYDNEHTHDDDDDNDIGFFQLMQAIFDPSQGFFNALLFVLASKSDRNNIMKLMCRAAHHMKQLCICRQRSEYEALRRSINDEDSSSSDNNNNNNNNNDFYSAVDDRNDECTNTTTIITDNSNQRNDSRDYIKEVVADNEAVITDRLLSNCSTAIDHPSLLDSASDYDCDSSERRMSEFSFDVRHEDKQVNRR